MANAAIAFDNTAASDDASITVDGALPSAPAANLINPHVAKKCRVNSDSMLIVVDQGSSLAFDTGLLEGVSGTNPSFRVRGSDTDNSGAGTDIFDSGVLTGTPYFDPDYGRFVYLRESVSARYVSFLVSESGASFIDVGLAYTGIRNAFGINFQAPFGSTTIRTSVDVIGVGQQTFVDLRQGHERLAMTFAFMSLSEATGFIRDMRAIIRNQGHLDMLAIPDPESTNLSADCLWGYHEGDFTVTQEQYLDPPAFTVTLNLRQRR